MTGMRRRVTIGFLSIVGLLFVSGMISLLELSRVSRDTGEILKASKRNIELARQMLDAAQEQNVALIRATILGDRDQDSVCRAALKRLEQTLLVAQSEAHDKSFLDSLAFATIELRLLIDGRLMREEPLSADTLAAQGPIEDAAAATAPTDTATLRTPHHSEQAEWYVTQYEQSYGRLTAAIQSYMTSTQSSLAPRAEQMKKNAYRAVTPVLISLMVMIAIVLMLFYFMSIYCVNPILRLNKGLGDYLAYRIPFAVKECKDEMLELKEKIETLINLSKQNKVQ